MKRFALIPILVFFAFLVPSKERAFAEGGIKWTDYYPEGRPICEAPAIQTNIRMAPDGSGGAIIVWEDFRNGVDFDIYAQRIDKDGNPQWDQNGVVVSTAPSNQLLPVVVGDGSGGAIIAWDDSRLGYSNIYALRIRNDTGEPYTGWISTGVLLSPSTYQQSSPDIVSDGSGGAIITWWEYDGSTVWMIQAQLITSAAVLPWGGATTVSQGGPKWYPKIINDGTGYVIITWEEWQGGYCDIYAQRVLISNGTPDWGVEMPVSEANDNQLKPEIVSDGLGGAIIVWTDFRNGTSNSDIYAQQINSDGVRVWDIGGNFEGIPICDAVGVQDSPVITSSLVGGTTDGAIIAWEDRREDINGDIYAEKVFLEVDPEWTGGGIPIATDESAAFIASQVSPRLVSDNQGGGFGTWIEYNGTSSKIFATRRNQDGQPMWSSYPGVVVCEGDQIGNHQIVNSVYGGIIVAWEGKGVAGDYDIFAQRVIDDESIVISSFISGRVTLPYGGGIHGVLVEALVEEEIVSSVTTDTEGYYMLTGLDADIVYTVRATWSANDILSSVSKDVSAPFNCFNFTLETDYELGTIAGNVSGVEGKHIASLSCKESKRISGSGLQNISSPGNGIAFVELEQRGKVIVRVPVEMDGNYSIPNLLPGRFIARAYNGTIYSNPRTVNLKEGETLRVNFAFGIMPGETVFNYPNPAKSGSTTIQYYCGYSDPEAEIKIYNIAGELVTKVGDSEINKPYPSENIYEFFWDCKNNSGKEIASGVYIYIVEVKDKNGSGSKKVVKRLAVIR